ncbi:hypothetical protein [Pseudomonas asplenii]|uniref:hypothetical protein n=1 Tax=Pseudomonas asplenii TaxID=53407 RepID=UPI00235F1E53|nr:hypothetical protein [Pseudomonas asplenii]
MLHSISAARHQAKFSRSACAWLMVDGIGIEQWAAQHLNYELAAMLGLSLIWLLEEEEQELAKRYGNCTETGTDLFSRTEKINPSQFPVSFSIQLISSKLEAEVLPTDQAWLRLFGVEGSRPARRRAH